MGEHAIKFLCHLSELSVDEYGSKNSTEFKSLWREAFSVVLQRCNALGAVKKTVDLLELVNQI